MVWDRQEAEATVADYFHMLMLELSGQSYNKSAHRKVLLQKLDGRTDSAIERKHQNISAILIEYGVPYISGYKPLGNYQALLRDVIDERLKADSLLERAVDAACTVPAVSPLLSDYSSLLVDPPKFNHVAREPDAAEHTEPFRRSETIWPEKLAMPHWDWLEKSLLSILNITDSTHLGRRTWQIVSSMSPRPEVMGLGTTSCRSMSLAVSAS
jgi:hypothetical protein